MMNASEANQIALANQEKYEKKKAKHLKRDLNSLHSQINRESKHGHYITRWDYRDSMDRETIKGLLLEEGYKIDEMYPYFEISWGEECDICHKKFRIK